MPFTFSHPAIVVPLKKIKPVLFSLTGLMAGSVSPDFQYFLQMSARSEFSHTLTGAFLFDLPVSVLIAIIFHLWIRNPFILSLPSPWDLKYSSFLSFDFMQSLQKRWVLFLISVLIGIFSHIYWDNLFKPEGWLYRWAPAFFGQTVYLGSTDFLCYVLIERIESVLGLMLIAWFFIQQKQPANPEIFPLPSTLKIPYWVTLFVCTTIISGLKIWRDSSIDTLGQQIIVVISAGLLSWAITSALFGSLLYRKQNV